jgi:IclR family acetate operon transcriptional repressor
MGKALAASLPSSERERLLTSLRFERFTPRTIIQLERLKEELENVRLRGYAVDDEEAVEGARCVSAPVLLDGDKLASALSVSGPTTRISRKKIPSFVEAVQKAARTISARLSQNGENGQPRKTSHNGHPPKT